MKSKKLAFILKALVIVGVLAAVMGALYLIFRVTGLTQYLRDYEMLTRTIRGFGPFGAVVYVIFVVISIVALPVPGILVILAGVAIYGPLYAMLLVSIGMVIGSMLAFAIGRVFGKSLIFWLFGKEKASKYLAKITKKGRGPLITMLILPFFPDDLLCMAAGVTDIGYGEFLFIVLVTRVPVVILTAFMGSGDVIPFDGWGRVVWIIIGSVVALGVLIWFARKFSKGRIWKKRAVITEAGKDINVQRSSQK